MIYELKNNAKIASSSIEKNFLEVRLSEHFFKTVSTFEKVPFTSEYYKNGNKLSLSDGKVIIGKGVKYIKISAQLMLDSSNTSASKLTMHLKKNNTTVVSETIENSPVRYTQLRSMPRILNVKENDFFEVLIGGEVNDKYPANTSCFLLVEVVQ